MSYKEKYLKYKTKYLQLKEQLGGSFREDIDKKEKRIKELKPKYSEAYRARNKSRRYLQKLREDALNNEEYKSLKKNISKVQTEVWNLKDRLRQSKADIDSNKSVLKTYFKTYDDEKEANDNLSILEPKVKQIEDQLKSKNDELNKLRKDRDEFRKKLLEQYSEESKKREPEQDRLKNEYRRYESEIRSLKAEINRIKSKEHDLYLEEKIKGFTSYTDGLDRSDWRLINHINKINEFFKNNKKYIMSDRKYTIINGRRLNNHEIQGDLFYYIGLFFVDIEADNLVRLIEIESFRNFIIRLGFLTKKILPLISKYEDFNRFLEERAKKEDVELKINKFKDLITAKDIDDKFKSNWGKNRSDESNRFMISSLINLNSLLSGSDYESDNDEFRVKSDGYMAFGGN